MTFPSAGVYELYARLRVGPATFNDDSFYYSQAGVVAVPAGTFGTFIANGTSTFVLGVAGATAPSIYNLQGLTLNGSVIAPSGTVIVNGVLNGGVIADRLIVNSNGVLHARD